MSCVYFSSWLFGNGLKNLWDHRTEAEVRTDVEVPLENAASLERLLVSQNVIYSPKAEWPLKRSLTIQCGPWPSLRYAINPPVVISPRRGPLKHIRGERSALRSALSCWVVFLLLNLVGLNRCRVRWDLPISPIKHGVIKAELGMCEETDYSASRGTSRPHDELFALTKED